MPADVTKYSKHITGGGALMTMNINCGGATTLFYEPGGLLLRSCLIPVDHQHAQHILTFQLGYLGVGEITVHVALEAVPDAPGHTAGPAVPRPVRLSGIDFLDDPEEIPRHGIPSVELSYVAVPGNSFTYRYTVWGQPGDPDDDLRGELSTVVSGLLPSLHATTRARATRKPLEPAIITQRRRTHLLDQPPTRCRLKQDAANALH